MLAVVGLGNPGRKYRNARHNLGFRVADAVAGRLGSKWKKGGGPYRLATWPDQDVMLVKPTTYMNNSGIAVLDLLDGYDLAPEQLLVIADDLNLPLGAVRVRRKGSDGGHNGLASIIRLLESERFPRMRLGIGPQPEDQDLVGFVLSPFDEAEVPVVEEMVARAADAVQVIAVSGIDAAMNRFNQKEKP